MVLQLQTSLLRPREGCVLSAPGATRAGGVQLVCDAWTRHSGLPLAMTLLQDARLLLREWA